MEAAGGLASLSPAEWAAKSAEIAGLNTASPTLSPEEEQQTIAAFKALSKDKKLLLARLMRRGCSNCEKEFKVPNVSWSHGTCERHRNEMYKMMGKTPPPSKAGSNGPIDLSTLSPEEQKLAVNLFAIVKKHRKSSH